MIVFKIQSNSEDVKFMFREYSSLRAKSVGPALYEEMTIDRPSGGKATVIIKGQKFFLKIMVKQ